MGLTREELFKKLNIIQDGVDLEKVVKKAMVDFEGNYWRSGNDHQTTSFYASQFPGSEKSCQRKMLYTLMNIPEVDQMFPKLRGMTVMGNAAEYFVVHRLAYAGKTISGSGPLHYGDEIAQTKFEDPDTMLSGAADLILDLRDEGYKWVLPVDIKSKDHDVIKNMQIGVRDYDEKHYMQVQAYIYLCRKFHEDMGWGDMGLLPAKAGMLYYVSRQDPTFVKQFYFDADEGVIDEALINLASAKHNWEKGTLPERPEEWKWTEEPCKWCPFKKEACKKDWKEGVINLKDSNGIEFAKHLKPEYDYDEVREKVEERWN